MTSRWRWVVWAIPMAMALPWPVSAQDSGGSSFVLRSVRVHTFPDKIGPFSFGESWSSASRRCTQSSVQELSSEDGGGVLLACLVARPDGTSDGYSVEFDRGKAIGIGIVVPQPLYEDTARAIYLRCGMNCRFEHGGREVWAMSYDRGRTVWLTGANLVTFRQR